jgi:hypothetical protein
MKRDFKYWLAWVLLIPALVLIGVLVHFPLHIILYQTLTRSGFITPFPKSVEIIIAPMVSAMIIVYCAYLIAPEHKIKVCLLITVLWSVFAGIVFALGYFNIESNGIYFNLQYGGMPIILGIVGTLIGLYFVKIKKSKTE